MDRKTVHQIAEILDSDGLIVNQWTKLAHVLDIPNSKVNEWKQGMGTTTMTFFDVLCELLEHWKSACPQNAKLQLNILINILKDNSFINAADKVEKFSTRTIPTQAEPKPNPPTISLHAQKFVQDALDIIRNSHTANEVSPAFINGIERLVNLYVQKQ